MMPQASLSLNKQKLDNLASEIWKSATRLRGKFKAYEYQNVILPIIVIRRLECVLLKWREDKKAEIRAKKPKLTEKEVDALVKKLELNPQQAPFSNKTEWTLRKVYEEDHTLLAENFRDYINGFSKNVDEIIEHFNYRAVIGEMVKRNRLAPILNQYKEEPLGPDNLSNLEMGYVYEELLRRFSEEAGEEAGDHFTPREVIRLMVELLEIPIPEKHLSIYDPACGTGGMLSVAQEHLLDRAKTDAERRRVVQLVTVHGQELSPPKKPPSHRGRVMIIDARKQFEKEPKAFSNKRNRMTDAHRQWIEERYRDGWKTQSSDDHVKIFQNNGKQKDFAYHKVSVIFWQHDENDQPGIITEKYEKSFTAANIAKEQAFYESELEFKLGLTDEESGCFAIVAFTLAPDDSFTRVYERLVRQAFPSEIEAATKNLTDATAKKKAVKRFIGSLQTDVDWTHRHYVKDDEYIPYGEDIEAFLKREIAKPIIRWEDSPQLGYEVLPNKYFYRYRPPTPAKDLLAEFWKLEKDAEAMLEGLAGR